MPKNFMLVDSDLTLVIEIGQGCLSGAETRRAQKTKHGVRSG